jgi:RNA polymerase sigma-70 factor (ECF subfamily)
MPSAHAIAEMTSLRNEARERELVGRIGAGDRSALDLLYGEYYPRLSRFLARLTQDRELVDEVVNDAFWVVWKKARDFRGESRVSTWIMGIAYRCTLKSLRRARSLPLQEDCELDEIEDTAQTQTQADHETRDWLRHGLELLPTEQRLTLEFAYYLGHSCEEIAVIMECPVNTVKARMFQARIKLRNLLPKLGGAGTETDRGRAG